MKNRIHFFVKIIFLFLFVTHIKSQDIFDTAHTVKYADYLFNTGEYKLAVSEYERLLFLDSTNCNHRLNLIRSYRKIGFYENALKQHSFYSNCNSEYKHLFEIEKAKCLIKANNYAGALFVAKNNLRTLKYEQDFLITTSFMFLQKWDSAGVYLRASEFKEDFRMQGFTVVLEKQKNMHFKNPFLSASMSAIIPGTGKIYNSYWKDGLISFLFVAVSAFQAHHGFEQKGIQSGYGWIFAGVGFSFYVGNIYGSYKSANKFNQIKNNKLIEEAKAIYNTYD